MVLPGNLEVIIEAKTDKANNTDSELEERAKDYAKRNTHNTAFEELNTEDINAVCEDEDTDDNTNIIESWRERIENETANCLLHARKHSRNREQEWVDRNHAHHINC